MKTESLIMGKKIIGTRFTNHKVPHNYKAANITTLQAREAKGSHPLPVGQQAQNGSLKASIYSKLEINVKSIFM